MIDGLVGGKIFGSAQRRTSANGNSYVTARVRAAAGDGDALFVNVIAFADAPMETLLALNDGDSASISGTLTPKVWTDRSGEARSGLDMVAHAVLTAYHVQRKRRAVASSESSGPHQSSDLDDDL